MQQRRVDGRYEVEGLLGGGGMAEVYLARDLVLGRDVAIKALREQYAGDEEFVERFRQEARNAAGLSHPNIVQVYDRGCSERGDYYIAMEYVPGGTLKDLLVEKGPLDPKEAAAVAGRVADALSAAHAKGVVHRDIKPHNVLVTGNGDVKVTDFGIARAASAAAVTATSVILGTATYMSPEQAQGEPATPKSDLYSLGVLLFEMLTGTVPYEGQTPVAVAVQHVSRPPRLPSEVRSGIPAHLNDVAAKLLAKDPEDRYASAAEAAKDLRRTRLGQAPLAAGAAHEAARTSRDEPTQMLAPRAGEPAGRAPRHRGRMLLGLAVPVVLVALVAAVAWAASGDLLKDRGPSPAAVLEDARQSLNGEVEVADVVGIERARAQERLVGAGFEVEVRRVESEEEKTDEVLRQSIPGGETAEKGTRISLQVGDGPAAVAAPDLTGLTLEGARGVLEEAGLSLGDVAEAASETAQEGEIVEQDPAIGEKLDPGTRVDLTVSSGPEPAPAPEPAPPPAASSPSSPQYAPAVSDVRDDRGQYEPAPDLASPATNETVVPDAPDVETPQVLVPDVSEFPFEDGGNWNGGGEGGQGKGARGSGQEGRGDSSGPGGS